MYLILVLSLGFSPHSHSRAVLSIGEVSHCLSFGITGPAQSTSADIMFKHISLQLNAESSRAVVLKHLRAKAVQNIILTKPFHKPLTLYSTHRLNQMARRHNDVRGGTHISMVFATKSLESVRNSFRDNFFHTLHKLFN